MNPMYFEAPVHLRTDTVNTDRCCGVANSMKQVPVLSLLDCRDKRFFFEEGNVPEKEITSYWVLVSKMCYPQLFGVAFNNKFIVDIIVFSWFKQCN